MVGTIKPYNLQEEEKVIAFWKKENVIKKVRTKQAKGKKTFYFMDGPPYATGHIHMGTALNKIMKDCAIRSQRMQGKKIFDRPGFDTHGLPIENKVEKKLGFKTKKDIEAFGIENFVEECKAFATEFVGTMGEEFKNLGDWMPYDDSYLTLTNEYIEAIWHTFKKADEQDLLYLGKYPVHVCPHCATAVAFNEIIYEKLSDTAIFVKLKLADEQNAFLLVWTTTPWTLPANVGVMVHPAYEYAYVKMSSGEIWIMAKEKVEELMNAFEAGYTIEKIVKGKELEGKKYLPLYPNVLKDEKQKGKAWRVILSDRYVNLEEGSGLVHTAPGHGKEDYDAGTKAGLPAVSPVNIDGTFSPEVEMYVGMQARDANPRIISELEGRGLIVYKHQYSHDYPLCWRCDSPLLMISTPQWFLRVTKIKEQMLRGNSKVKWVPEWMNDRMKNWLENINDWPVSRERYWGTPLPIWVCECGKKKVIGSIAELKKEAKLRKNVELHRPYIDEIKIKCRCGGEMERVKAVLDVWFDSGVSSWANLGFPQSKKLFDEFWPADLNIEMTEQVRGWWNSQSILSTISFGKLPYKAVSVHGMVRDLGHQKMSKSKGNIVTPEEMIKKYNRDYLRHYLLSQGKGTDFNFDIGAISDVGNFFNTFTNSLNYAKMYLNIDLEKKISGASAKKLLEEDRWILSRLEELSKKIISAYNNYEFFKAGIAVEEFVDLEFSRAYLKLIRNRIGTKTQKQAEQTVSYVISVLLKLFAPIAPHASEYYWREFGARQTIHLEDFEKISGLRNEALEKEFELVQSVAQAVFSLRTEQKLRLRWQLEKVIVESDKKISGLLEVLARMCNVKSAENGKNPGSGFAAKDFGAGKVYLKVSASPEMKEEWELSELLRQIQDARKKAGLSPGEKVKLEIECGDKKFLEKNRKKIEEKTSAEMVFVSGKKLALLVEKEFFFEIKR
ncbi:MAG: isoleucine--tRNA ligase [Candidatus Diapherotrites archaeon]|nr:isoleucine--tRNA ligase [Candidatus Diapherotrites archaeon]